MDILTTEQAASILKCGCSTVRKHAGIIGVEKFGSRWLIKPDDIDRLKESIHHTWGK